MTAAAALTFFSVGMTRTRQSSWAIGKAGGHYEKYLAGRQATGVFDKFTEGLEGPPNLRYFDLTDA